MIGRRVWAAFSGAITAVLISSPSIAQIVRFDVPSEEAGKSLPELARQAGVHVIAPGDVLHGLITPEIKGTFDFNDALKLMLKGTGLAASSSPEGVVISLREPNKSKEREEMSPKNSSSILAIILGAFGALSVHQAHAQDAGASASAPPGDIETVTVTGSRILRNGNEAPTPVTLLTAQDLSAMAPNEVSDALVKLPQLFSCSFSCSNTAAQNNQGGSLSGGTYLNLNNLGASRVLVLQNGHRVTPTNNNNTVDVETLPTQFLQRVDVVTGGASAVYGSDAVAGVVNYVTDTHYNGLKGQFSGGISGYGDGKDVRAALAGGMDLFGGRGHIEASADFFSRDAIPRGGRPYANLSPSFEGNGTAAFPYTLVSNTRQSNVSYGGLITTGPLAGQQFLPNGSLGAFNPGTPTTTANLAIGGDGATEQPETLIPSELYHQEYARFDYNISNSFHWYVETSFGQERTWTRPTNQIFTSTSFPITIYSGNAYLTPAEQAAAFPNPSILSFNLNRYMQDIGSAITFTGHVTNFSVTTGLNGDVFGDWKWETYFTHGQGHSVNISKNNINAANFYAAVDAVSAPAGNSLGIPAGQIVCRATLVTPGLFPGCQPLDLFGDGAPSQAARNYIYSTTYYTINNTLDDFAANLTGTIFDGWAGPIKAATGVEYRAASFNQTSNVPNLPLDPTGLRGPNPTAANPVGSFPAGTLNYTKNIVSPSRGANSVYEGNIELNVPILAKLPGAELVSLDGAYRYTDYSTSGSANTWRVGLDWAVIDSIRIRATHSRDILAPSLLQLFQTQSVQPTNITDVATNSGGRVNLVSGGNPNLKPEVAQNTTAGVVFTPAWLQGFSLSADFFRTYIGNAIGSVSGANTTVQALCLQSNGTSPLCGLIVRPTPTSFPTQVLSYNANIGVVYTEGENFEIDYGFDLADMSDKLAGSLTNRVFITRQPIFESQTIPGSVFTQSSGTKALPTDRIEWNLDYSFQNLDVGMVLRYFDPVVNSIQPGVYYANQPIGSYTQVDLNLAYTVSVDNTPVTGFLNINNLTDNPGPYAWPIGPSLNPGFFYPVVPYADPIGRYFTLGVKFAM